jgi:hypothetical protein
MMMCVLFALSALDQEDGSVVAALGRPPEPAAPAPATDWRDLVLRRLPVMPELLEPSDVEVVPLDLRVEELGLARLREIEDEPVLFPALSRILFGGPAFVLEGVAALTLPDRLTIGAQRIFDRGTGEDDLAWIFGRTLLRREISFLAGLGGSYVVTPGVEFGLEEVDTHRFDRLQQKVIYDSFKRAYRERYAIPAMEFDTVLEAAQSGSWLDYVVIPGLVSAYTAKFGLERKFHIGEDLRIQLSIEKGTRFYKVATQDHGGRLAAVAINLFDLPVSAIVSVDSLEKGIGLGFVGIGTDLNAVIEAVNGARGTTERDRR